MKKKFTDEVQDRKDWHSAFTAGIELVFRKYKGKLTFEREHLLSKGPQRIDLLISRKEENVKIDNSIGIFFKGHNIIEYKNPEDDLDIDVLWKVIGYAALYKSQGEYINAIPSKDITISIFITVTAISRNEFTRNDNTLFIVFLISHSKPLLSTGISHFFKTLIDRCYRRIKYLTII